jgi:uncharacterized membrane protein YccC
LPITLDLRAISAEEGVRAGLSVAALVLANDLLHAPILLESALAALLACLCDSGGPARTRVPALLAFAVLGGLMVGGFGLLRPLGFVLIPLACLAIFCFSFARIYGQAAQQVGNLLSVVLVLALDRSQHGIGPALMLGGSFVGGALWALVLTLVIWRLHPNRPSRRAVARVYAALATLCDDLGELVDTQDGAAEREWERHARQHRRAVRDLIEQARAAVGDRLRSSGATTPATSQSLLRLESADQLFRAVIGLTDLLESGADAATRVAGATLALRLAAVLRGFASHIAADHDAGMAAIGAAIASLSEAVRDLASGTTLRRLGETVVDRLWITLNLAGAAEAVMAELPERAGWLERLVGPLRANVTWRSAALRHAARAAVVSAAGFAITFTWPTSYQHWLTITMILTLQPYYALTLQRALERIGGTVLGGLLAAALSLVCHTPLSIAAAILPLSVLALSLRAVNFGLYMTALTPLIVLLVELAAPAHGHATIVVMRALYTLIGGALAVLGCVFLWPSWEPDRLDQELRLAVRSHGRFGALALGLLQGDVPAAAVDAARREAGMASNNLEASLSRALLEPRRAGRERLDAVMVVDAALRRMAGRLSAMQAERVGRGGAGLAAWRGWIETVTALLDKEVPPPLPDRPEDLPEEPALREGLTRVARQLELSAGALRRYGAI